MSSNGIPDSARNALAFMEQLMQEGFTGTLIVECNQGGVAEVRESKTFRAKDLAAHQNCVSNKES